MVSLGSLSDVKLDLPVVGTVGAVGIVGVLAVIFLLRRRKPKRTATFTF